MPDISNSAFLTALQANNTTIHAILSGTSTMGTTITPSELTWSVTESLKDAQNTYNAALTTTDFINTITQFDDSGSVLFDGNGNAYQDRTATIRVRQKFSPEDVDPYMGGVEII